MACSEIIDHEGRIIGHICTAGKRKPTDKAEVKWCFTCRMRGLHRLFLLIAEWYEPEPLWICPHCNHDRTRFPNA